MYYSNLLQVEYSFRQITKETTNKANCEQQCRLDWTETGPEFGFQTICEVQISSKQRHNLSFECENSLLVSNSTLFYTAKHKYWTVRTKKEHVFDWRET